MNGTTALSRAFAHNAWANGLLFDGLRRAPADFLDREARPGGGTNREKLRHLALVERGFHDAIRRSTSIPEAPSGLEDVIAYCEETAAAFGGLLSGPVDVEEEVHIPWWERNFTIGDCLAQVLSHSGQHRAELAWELASSGIDTGEMDYIVWFARQHG
jgi:uncharacterized damage-inducible protein DinB